MGNTTEILDKRIFLGKNAEIHHIGKMILRNRVLEVSDEASITISEITILPGEKLDLGTKSPSLQLIIPVVGELKLESGLFLETGEVWSKFIPKKMSLSLENPFDKDPVHFIRIEVPTQNFYSERTFDFDLEDIANKVFTIAEFKNGDESFRLSLGNLQGRTDHEFQTYGSSFSMAVTGVFEFQNCLLEQGDALSINQSGMLEMEALTTEAMILILEYKNMNL